MRLYSWASFIIMLAILVPFPYGVDAQPLSTNTSLRPSELHESKELLIDPTLTTEPEYAVLGSSGEFSFKYKNASSESSGGAVALNWTHVQGTELVFDTSGITPECQEFVYFSQDFTWDLDTLPSSLNLSLGYQITRTGRFLTQYSSALFEIRFWFIHPDGIWQEITRFGGGQDFYRSNSYTISSIYFEDLFDKLMTGSIPEYLPAAKLAVGLVPTWRFFDDSGLDSDYNGSVIADITEIRLSALYRRLDERVAVEMPSFSNSWQVGSSGAFRDSFMASDDSFYVLTVEEPTGIGLGSTLTRVDTRGDEIWRKTWDVSERMIVHSVAATPYNIYVIGTIYGPGVSSNVGLYALDVNGNPLWNSTLDYSPSDYPGDVGVNSKGEIFIGISTALSPFRNVLIKLDSTGNILWERWFGATQWDRVEDVEVCDNGNIYARTDNHLSLWTDDGDNLWSMTRNYDDAYTLRSGSVLATHPTTYGAVSLTCRNVEGEQEWATDFEIEYTQDWWDLATISSAIDGPNGTILVLLWIYGFHPGRLLLYLDSNGNQLLNRTLSFSEGFYDVSNIPQYIDMYMDSNGLLYFVGEYFAQDSDYSIIVGVYDFGGVVTSMINSSINNSSIAFALVIVVVIGVEMKRRLSRST
ncbi:MAG: hypothetical protein ACFFDM_07010 [Candidatus Thorarchaeota archaeon]